MHHIQLTTNDASFIFFVCLIFFFALTLFLTCSRIYNITVAFIFGHVPPPLPPPLQEISGFSILFASWLPLLLQAVTQNESVLNEQKQ